MHKYGLHSFGMGRCWEHHPHWSVGQVVLMVVLVGEGLQRPLRLQCNSLCKFSMEDCSLIVLRGVVALIL